LVLLSILLRDCWSLSFGFLHGLFGWQTAVDRLLWMSLHDFVGHHHLNDGFFISSSASLTVGGGLDGTSFWEVVFLALGLWVMMLLLGMSIGLLRLLTQERTVTCWLKYFGLDWTIGAILVLSDVMRIEMATTQAHCMLAWGGGGLISDPRTCNRFDSMCIDLWCSGRIGCFAATSFSTRSRLMTWGAQKKFWAEWERNCLP